MGVNFNPYNNQALNLRLNNNSDPKKTEENNQVNNQPQNNNTAAGTEADINNSLDAMASYNMAVVQTNQNTRNNAPQSNSNQNIGREVTDAKSGSEVEYENEEGTRVIADGDDFEFENGNDLEATPQGGWWGNYKANWSRLQQKYMDERCPGWSDGSYCGDTDFLEQTGALSWIYATIGAFF